MRKIDQLLEEYGVSHQNQTNKMIHWFCVPAIFFSVVGLIYSIPAGSISFLQDYIGAFANWATIVLAVVLFYYYSLSPPLALGMFLFSALCLFLANFITIVAPIPLWAVCLIIFLFSWALQFYGHKIEGKKPSFLKDIQFLLIGPAWLMHFIYKQLGFSY
ncbi:DUF962 domain-containing protein [Echinicola soli]|uniref:DUF962 domain-containing protein n=1 Tax=Echinicola soli TaxID=2591634 RepID=A0A514CP45_9BACT|nr:Mpo1-like protein [Echinicola soli]QDH81583.1 DUF962 domain-containing protein [Echinicola soli]